MGRKEKHVLNTQLAPVSKQRLGIINYAKSKLKAKAK